MSQKISLVFFGTGPVSLATLNGIAKHFTIEAIITKPAATHHGKAASAPVADWAKQHGTELFEPADPDQLEELFIANHFKSSVGVVVDYGLIIPEPVIKSFPKGIVNSHFSLLPRWRGADPISYAILHGDAKTGVSLMLIEPELDTGKLLAQKSLAIDATDTTPTLTEHLIELSNRLLIEHLPKYVSGKLSPHAQPHPDRATYSEKLTKQDGQIDWHKAAEQIEREIRAYQGWPGSRASFRDKHVIITKALVRKQESGMSKEIGEWFETEDGQLAAQTGNGALVIERIKPAGKAEMTGSQFVNGYVR